MKYTIQKLDGRFSYHNDFNYCIKFSNRMSGNDGPLAFTRSHKWFIDTYGWSAEIRQWNEIRNWYTKSMPMMSVKGGWVRPVSSDIPTECNPIWSWALGYEDLRIYVYSDKELAFFQLAHQVD